MRSLDGYERKQNLPEIFYCSPQPPDTNLIKTSPFVSDIRRTDKYKLHIMHSLDAFGHRAHENSMPSSEPLFRQMLTFIRRGVTTCYKSDVDEINQILFTVLPRICVKRLTGKEKLWRQQQTSRPRYQPATSVIRLGSALHQDIRQGTTAKCKASVTTQVH
jgi:hypothetical protein